MARNAGGGAGGAVVVTGVKEIDRRLKALVPKLQKKVIRQAMRKGMKLVTAAAKANAPVRTGKLRKAIKTRAGKSKKRGVIKVVTRVGEGDFQGETFYAAMVEFGTKNMPPHPFMAPAYDQTKDVAKKVAMDAIIEGVEREASSKA